ncbi:hypothetical protein [Marinifilum flexuosum]|uniref:hypothetical protein n=1 Tax=Marinifilum flexuosum TaxID=1117708 RepID=UPI002490163C|nr:hypothetical protein [Marinifilum flexuosum]
MGTMPAPGKCFITDLQTFNIPNSTDAIEYQIAINGKRLQFICPYDHKNSHFVEENKYILKGLLANGILLFENSYFDNKVLEKTIREAQVPRSPKEKLDNLLLFLHSKQQHEGAIIKPLRNESKKEFPHKLYFKNFDEYIFYLNSLKEQKLIANTQKEYVTRDGEELELTFKGLEYIIKMQENGTKSKNCFIAMSFNNTEQIKDIRSGIKEAVRKCDFNPILIDEVHIDSDVTINDAIISQIKKSKFLIADFSEQKHGVYFEAGYALGQKKPVIYTCHEDYFKNSHFDTNHYPHIIYKDIENLKQQLINKIQAWIN